MLLLFCRPYGAVGCCGCCDCCGCCGRCDCCDCCDCFVCRGSAALHRLPVVVAPLRGCGLLRLLRSLRLLRLFCLQGFRCASPPACGRCAPTGLWVVAVVAVVAPLRGCQIFVEKTAELGFVVDDLAQEFQAFGIG